ncbi:MAG: glycoside hydrolase family 9 protein [Bacteroidales bacterium]
MKKILVSLLFLSSTSFLIAGSWIRVNQMGYLPISHKTAVFISDEAGKKKSFVLKDANTDKVVFKGNAETKDASIWGMKQGYRLNFDEFETPGTYYVELAGIRSNPFKIDVDVYKGSADYILNYMRQQRCGYNPFLGAACHQDDGIIVDHPTKTGQHLDVTGGWHDAADYLQYVTTSANATYQMLFAYAQNPGAFGDNYNALGQKGSNGIPDILDEAKWGLDWLVRMNPDSAEMYNQIADDRDHRVFDIPTKDTVDYGWGRGKERPIYFVTGKPQGLGKHINRSTGVASTAAKFASSFALGAELFRSIDPEFSQLIATKAKEAYAFAESDPGVNQTACLSSPYFYEEDNYVDDLELAAATFSFFSGKTEYQKRADYWGSLEPITPWMETAKARHYQWYPFVNLGHFLLASSSDKEVASKYSGYMKDGLEYIRQRGESDPFYNGVPYLWCSCNFVVGALTQAQLYYQVTGDTKYSKMEAALRDWLFGCNPWGTSMICGLPENGDYPELPHSGYTKENGVTTHGGLVDGPVYQSIFNNLRGLVLYRPDNYSEFQTGVAVYHDDLGDYSTNEPTMDGTASLSFYLSTLEELGKKQSTNK